MSGTIKQTKKKGGRKVGNWYLGEALGKGSYSWVKKGYDINTSKPVALKFIDTKRSNNTTLNGTQLLQVQTEIESLKKIKHTNVIRLFAYNMHTIYPTEAGSEGPVILLVLEYLSGGKLFDLMPFEQIMTRTYFQQLIAALEALHNLGIIHRDIKPDNLLLDKNFTLKLCDTGLTNLIKTYDVGSRGYQAPEILLKQPYTSSIDIFSAGVILFILLCGYPPFQQAKLSDNWYGNIATSQYKAFWISHAGCGILPPAMDLITRMLVYSPEKRISLANIKKHDWYLGKILSQRQLTKTLT